MKKILAVIALLSIVYPTFGQFPDRKKKTKERKDDFSVTIRENEKNNIDWKPLAAYFDDKNKSDSVQFSVKFLQPKNNNLSSEKKYTVKGLAENINELIEVMKRLIN